MLHISSSYLLQNLAKPSFWKISLSPRALSLKAPPPGNFALLLLLTQNFSLFDFRSLKMATLASTLPTTFDRYPTVSTDHEQPKYDERNNLAHLSIWRQVESELSSFQAGRPHFSRNKQIGQALAVLLDNAGYPVDMQYRDLKFFAQVVAPNLGVARGRIEEGELPGFMTDNGIPIEMSWDWGTTNNAPTIRYSIEPIGLHAGSSPNPSNLITETAFQKQLLHSLPDVKLDWFHHFEKFFHFADNQETDLFTQDPRTSVFYAFDLSPAQIASKAYFFPKPRATAYSQTSLEVLSQAIQGVPSGTEDNLKAWSIFHDFCAETENQALEHEMLAIDLIDPKESRIESYFRSPETSFFSVINIMTLGGRIRDRKLDAGIRDLNRLWNAIFGVNSAPDRPLDEAGHRSSGILFNMEFKLGSSYPMTTIYLPVRHYARSDEAIFRGLNDYFQFHQRGKYMPNYIEAMSTLL